MNPFDGAGAGREAKLEYLDAEFQIISPGDYVLCAITGNRIELEALRYWNVDRQEAYIDAHAAIKGFGMSEKEAGK